ncbi:MAG: helix-hairpin-helix domain-containing protein, partial [Succiniclasticum sp.]
DEADMDRVNLAQLCKDGGHIKVPRLSKARMKKLAAEKNGSAGIAGNGFGAVDNETAADSERTDSPENKKDKNKQISLNSATETELTQLPGIGAATARKIVAFRNRHRFQVIEDVMKIPGISPAKFAKMKALLVL